MPQSTSDRLNSQDTDIAVLAVKQTALTEHVQQVSDLLDRHVTGCAKLQKWVLGVLIFIAGWAVAHSPEVMKLVTTIIGAL